MISITAGDLSYLVLKIFLILCKRVYIIKDPDNLMENACKFYISIRKLIYLTSTFKQKSILSGVERFHMIALDSFLLSISPFVTEPLNSTLPGNGAKDDTMSVFS